MSVKTYHHLTQAEKWQIKGLLESRKSLRGIAVQLGRSVSTICDERKRGFISQGYSPIRSQQCYLYTRKKSGRTRRKLHGRLWRDVRDCLHMTWSPEQIFGRFRAIGLAEVSHATIYAQIYRTESAGLLRCLRHSGKKYAYGRAGKSLIPDRVDIRERPTIVDQNNVLETGRAIRLWVQDIKARLCRSWIGHPNIRCCSMWSGNAPNL